MKTEAQHGTSRGDSDGSDDAAGGALTAMQSDEEGLWWRTTFRLKIGETKMIPAASSWGFGRGTWGEHFDVGGRSYIGTREGESERRTAMLPCPDRTRARNGDGRTTPTGGTRRQREEEKGGGLAVGLARGGKEEWASPAGPGKRKGRRKKRKGIGRKEMEISPRKNLEYEMTSKFHKRD